MKSTTIRTNAKVAACTAALALASLLAGCGGGGSPGAMESPAKASTQTANAPDACDWVPDAGEWISSPPQDRTAAETPDPGSRVPSTVAIMDAGGREGFWLPIDPASQSPDASTPYPRPLPQAQTELLFAVVRSGNLDNSVVVHYSSHAGTATEYADYEPVQGYVAFAPQQQLQYIRVNFTNDYDPECTERFTIRLEPASPSTVVVRGTATGWIADDESSAARQPEMPSPAEPELALVGGNDYCEAFTADPAAPAAPCMALSCATGETLYWTHCPTGKSLHVLLLTHPMESIETVVKGAL